MLTAIVPTLIMAVSALVGARLSDSAISPMSADPCAKIEKSRVVWAYEATDQTMASECARKGARRVLSSSPR